MAGSVLVRAATPVMLGTSVVLGVSGRAATAIARVLGDWERMVERGLEVPHLRWEDVVPGHDDAGDLGRVAGIDVSEGPEPHQ